MSMTIRASRHRLAHLVTLLAMLAVLLAGCDFNTKLPDLAKDQTLRMALPFGATTFPDPVRAYDTVSQQITSLLFDGLVTLDRNEHTEPWGANSWTVSPDGLTYTFTLRPHQRFSDGTPVKPSDYAWSMDRAANPCTEAYVDFSFLAALKDARAYHSETCSGGKPSGAIKSLVGDSIVPNDSANTLSLILARPTGYFLAALATPAGDVLERSVVTGANLGKDSAWVKNLAQGVTGQGNSGMFYMASWVQASNSTPGRLILKPNPYWWGQFSGKKPHFTEIDYSESYAGTSAYSAFLSDQAIAYAGDLPIDQSLMSLKQQPYYHEQPALISGGLMLNWKIAPFDDINARKAFCLALNREQLNQQAFHGGAIPSWHIVPQGMDGYNAQLRGIDGAPITGDTTLAKRYWRQYLAAHHNVVPHIALPVSFASSAIQTAIALHQATWQQVLGVQVGTYTIHTIVTENPMHYQQLVRFSWGADYPDPHDFLTTIYNGNAPFNYQNASVPTAGNLMLQADTLSDMSQRIPLYQQAEQLLIDNVAVCPLYQAVNHYALRPWVKGDFVEDARGLFPNDAWVTGYIAKH